MSDRTLAIVLAIGFIALFLALVVLVWTRWGQARPIAKCAGLSLAAHLLLFIYAYSTRVLFDQPGSWLGQTVKVHIVDAQDDEEAAPAPELASEQPWDRPGEDDSRDINVFGPAPSPSDALAPQPTAIARRARPAESVPPAAPTPQPASPPEPIAAAEPPAPAPPTRPVSPASIPEDLTNLLAEIPLESASSPAKTSAPAEATIPPPQAVAAPPTELLAAPEPEPITQPPAPADQTFAAAVATVPRRLGDGEPLAEPLRARVGADRLKVAQPFGATPQTEAAVAKALEWLAANQSADGRWDADQHGAGKETRTLGHDRQGAGGRADTGVTGLALLAFLGNGQTHLAGRHREHVQHGLEFLLASQAANGSLAGDAEFFASMYCHGIATLALAEAYALTGDERLLSGLNKALRYTIAAQHAGGGWRYQPDDEGDISQFGWQLMALHSAELAGLPIPAETRTRMARFLRAASSGPERGLASYRPGDRVSRTMTAEALVCRQFLAAENRPATLAEGAAYVVEEKPGDGPTNLYYWYYGTLALFQRQGPEWEAWNAALQRQLLYSQRHDGERRGSWDPDPLWGGYGGRVYSTSMAALCLEVYYRYLPLHGREDLLTDRPIRSPIPR
jgi:hypothetical protein